MTVDVPLLQPKSLADVLYGLAQASKAGTEANYAGPTAQANLDKIKALITGQNLENQTSQLKMPYVTKREEADIGNKVANTGYLNAEAHFLPTKYAIQGMNAQTALKNYLINANRYSPEANTIHNDYLKSLIKKNEQSESPIAIPGLAEEGETPKKNWYPLNTGRASNGVATRFQNSDTGQIFVPLTKQGLIQVEKEKTALDKVTPLLEEIRNLGMQGFLTSPSKGPGRFLQGGAAARYDAILTELNDTLIPTFGNSPKIKKLLEGVTALSDRRTGETAKEYGERIRDAENKYKKQLINVNKKYVSGGTIEEPKLKNGYPQAPKDPSKLKEWFASVPKEVGQAYINGIK